MSKKTKRFFIFAVAVLLTFVAGFILPWLSQLSPGFLGGAPVVDGVLDGVVVEGSKDIYLSGEWQFFKGEHIISQNLENIEPDSYVKVPSPWTEYELDGHKLNNGGSASYRAYIKNIDTKEPFVVTVPNVPGQCKVFVDGECVFSNRGFYADSVTLTAGTYSQPVAPDFEDNVTHEIVIEMTCEYSSGLTTIPVLSEYEHFQSSTMTNLALRYLLVGIVLFFALAVLLFTIMRKDMNIQIWLVVLCVAFIFRMLISNTGYLASYRLFGGINYEIMVSLVFVSTYIIKLSMMMHLNNTARLNIKQNTIVFISALFLICAFVPYFLYDYIYVADAYIWLQSVPYILDIVMIYKLSEAIAEKKRFSAVHLVAYCITASAIIIDNYFINGYIAGTVSWVMPTACVVFISCMVLVHFVETVDAFSKAKEAARLSRELSDINMTLMLSQIQPHFLYNALNTIKYLTKKDPKAAETAIVKFSNYLRANMDSLTQKEPIPFENELEHVKNYISIEMLRFADRLSVEYDIRFSDFKIPPLTVQPIAENAIKHGVNQRPEGGTVKITAYEENGNAVVVVEDNGVGFDINQKHTDNRSHVGIKNIIVRLKEMMNAEVKIESVIGKGTKVTIIIPKEEAYNENNGSR